MQNYCWIILSVILRYSSGINFKDCAFIGCIIIFRIKTLSFPSAKSECEKHAKKTVDDEKKKKMWKMSCFFSMKSSQALESSENLWVTEYFCWIDSHTQWFLKEWGMTCLQWKSVWKSHFFPRFYKRKKKKTDRKLKIYAAWKDW